MRSFSDMTKTLGRTGSLKQGKRPSLSIDEPKPTPTVPVQPQSTAIPSADTDVTNNIKPKQPADDLMSIVETLARPPSQDISRPFDNIPPPRASESKSMRGKKRRSVVGNLPPTVGVPKLVNDSTSFGDSFKSFMYESEPESVAQHDDHKPSTSPASDGLTALMSSTTLSENSTSKSVAEHHPPTPTMKHGSPSKDIGSYFKTLFTMKSRFSSHLKPDAPSTISSKAEADIPAGMQKGAPSTAPSVNPTDSKKEKNAKELSIPTSPKEGKSSDSTNGEPQDNAQLRPPASPNPSVKSGSLRYEPGVNLQPVAEEEAE